MLQMPMTTSLTKPLKGLVLLHSIRGSLHLPSRALIQESVYDRFMERALARVKAIAQGSPLDTSSMMARRHPSSK